MIKKCASCKPHEYQDKKYGENVRVHNTSPTGKGVHCTVCGRDAAGEGNASKK